MKKILFMLMMLPSLAFANTTNSLRTPGGDLVQVGETEQSLIAKMGKPSPTYYVLDDGKLYCSATVYTYKVDLQEYKVISCKGKIVKIEWRNL